MAKYYSDRRFKEQERDEEEAKKSMREDASEGGFGKDLKDAWESTVSDLKNVKEKIAKGLKIGKYGWVGSLTNKKKVS